MPTPPLISTVMEPHEQMELLMMTIDVSLLEFKYKYCQKTYQFTNTLNGQIVYKLQVAKYLTILSCLNP